MIYVTRVLKRLMFGLSLTFVKDGRSFVVEAEEEITGHPEVVARRLRYLRDY